MKERQSHNMRTARSFLETNSSEYAETDSVERKITEIAKSTGNIPAAIWHNMRYEQETSQKPLTDIEALEVVEQRYRNKDKTQT